MNYWILAAGVLTAALWFPVNVCFVAATASRHLGKSYKPNALLYLALGALIGAMVAMGVIQCNPSGLHGLLIVPGILVGMPLFMATLFALFIVCLYVFAYVVFEGPGSWPLQLLAKGLSAVARSCRNLGQALSKRINL